LLPEPGDEQFASGAEGIGGVEGCAAVGPGWGAVQFGAERKEMLSHPPLTAVACLPERIGQLLCRWRVGGDQLVDA
jgi:hypothetical protein